ncbi:MAG: hypothetical protein SVP26_07770 [Chloroflexota bacterium]|nr:hypothetical protein [Chloroflexota bacterium]
MNVDVGFALLLATAAGLCTAIGGIYRLLTRIRASSLEQGRDISTPAPNDRPHGDNTPFAVVSGIGYIRAPL